MKVNTSCVLSKPRGLQSENRHSHPHTWSPEQNGGSSRSKPTLVPQTGQSVIWERDRSCSCCTTPLSNQSKKKVKQQGKSPSPYLRSDSPFVWKRWWAAVAPASQTSPRRDWSSKANPILSVPQIKQSPIQGRDGGAAGRYSPLLPGQTPGHAYVHFCEINSLSREIFQELTDVLEWGACFLWEKLNEFLYSPTFYWVHVSDVSSINITPLWHMTSPWSHFEPFTSSVDFWKHRRLVGSTCAPLEEASAPPPTDGRHWCCQ